jgi:hypothetical protein
MKIEKMDGFVFIPETVGDLVKFEEMVRGLFDSDIGNWFLKYWRFVHENEHGNECSVKELFDTDAVSETFDLAFTSKPLSEWGVWEYLSKDSSLDALMLMSEFIQIKWSYQ